MPNDTLISEFKIIQTKSKNTREDEEFSFIPAAPYDSYEHGVVVVGQHGRTEGRRYVVLSSPRVTHPQFKRIHTFARYAFQVHLWKTGSYLIPGSLHVDHINDDAMDDRLDNYQLLTGEQNTRKQALLRGALMAVMICPVCLSHFEKRASTTQYADNKKPKKLIFYCCTRCHLASEFTMQGHEKYRELRDWISDNQIFKVIRVWTTGETKLEATVSEKMLEFDLSKATGVPINYGSPKFASTNEKKVMIRDLRNQGLSLDEVTAKMDMSKQTVWKLAAEPLRKVHLDDDALAETLTRIKHWRNQGYSQERIGALLGIPRTSVSNYVRRHSAAWGILNDTPASKGESLVTLICPVCHAEFERPLELTQLISSRAGRIMCCCSDCRWDLRVKMNRVSDRAGVRQWLSENQIIRVDKIIPSGVRFFDRIVPHDPLIRTVDIPTFSPPQRAVPSAELLKAA